jgi:hypothetical protein
MNLILAAIWLALGITLVTYEHVTGTRRFLIMGTDISAAYFPFLLVAYNLVRWLFQRMARAKERALREIQESMDKRRTKHPPRKDEEEYNPSFDFSDKPPSPPSES